MEKSTEEILKATHAIDGYVGRRLRKRREKLDLSQTELGKLIGISYQQIQKYERGDNKIPAGRLYQIAQVLRVTTEYFFKDINAEELRLPEGHICTERTTPLNILLIEDDPTDQMLTRNALEECGIKNNLYIIQDGEHALTFLRHRVNEDFPRPDIILLDLNIPKRDGSEVLREIKRDRTLEDIPVIVLTNSSDPEDMLRSYKDNVSGYISKSFDINIFNRNIAITVDYWSSVSILPSMQYN